MKKIKKMIQEYRKMRNQVKGMSEYYSKYEILEMMKYCNNTINCEDK